MKKMPISASTITYKEKTSKKTSCMSEVSNTHRGIQVHAS